MLYFQSLRKNRLFFFFVKREKAEFYWSRQRLIFEPKSSLKVVHSTSKRPFFCFAFGSVLRVAEDHFSLLLWVAGFELWSLIFSTSLISCDGFEPLTFCPTVRSSTTRAKASGPRFKSRLWLTVPHHLNIFFSVQFVLKIVKRVCPRQRVFGKRFQRQKFRQPVVSRLTSSSPTGLEQPKRCCVGPVHQWVAVPFGGILKGKKRIIIVTVRLGLTGSYLVLFQVNSTQP